MHVTGVPVVIDVVMASLVFGEIVRWFGVAVLDPVGQAGIVSGLLGEQ